MFVVKRRMPVTYKNGLCTNLAKTRKNSAYQTRNNNDENVNTSYKSIVDFYAGKSVFVTGATGFLGKVMVEKLLYSCTDIDKVYLLVREKRKDNFNVRIANMLNNTLFDRLKEEKPEVLNKIIPIEGDLTAVNLGISDSDQQKLKENVSVVIHSGATVSFSDPLSVAININFGGTQKMLELSKQMKKLEAFVYTSTAFSQTTKKVLEEIVYPAPAEIDEIYKFIKDYGHIEKETRRFLNGRPSTYTFSKALCENYIANNCGHIPTIIIRPSIVTPIKDGPVPGWLDNWGGITGVLDNMAKGWNRVTLGKGHYVPDMIPVDYVSNLTIAAAAKFDRSQSVSVFNSCSSSTNPITWAETYALFIEECKKRGYDHIPYPFTLYSNSEKIVKWLTILLQYTPAYIADLAFKLIGKKPRFIDIQNHVLRTRAAIEYFTSHTWEFKSDETRRMYNNLSPEDQKQFPFNPSHINWNQYVPIYCSGIQKHLRSKVHGLLKDS